ncbi:amino acid permease [Gammaproteobacteria bacterium]|jgi:APA family basic amino acid/polyamine antiporter|nr:amino acid permease [Gammaproteobacteria bacterium]MDA9141301.1 amino acid permease [Gammaproteobacteria bacterium]MDA9935676.1 amino acid permease [Gammaproteobacteria bacterium]MDA9965208.1 amino acid permease [Gammaproteobacteria bacterium]MDB0009715.1 amino acid permease [Gammaproteobacteria bacterium]
MSSDQHRVIGFWRGWSIAVGCAIGSGIFMMPTMLAPYGLLGFGGWLVAGAGSILVALTMARLVKRIPKTGGPYVYVNEGLGKFSGFIIAWTYWVACVSAIAGISIAFVGYLGFFLPQIANSQIHALLASLLLIWIIVFLNIRSLENSSKFQLISTLLKLLPLIFIVLLGASNFNLSNLPELNPTNLHPISLIATVTTLVMWSFIGIETATVPADNVINPQETIPKVLIASVITILILYISVSVAIAVLVPASELLNSSAPFALAASKILGVTGGTIISLGALISTLGSLNANTLTAGNLSLAAARDGFLPSKFVILTKNGTPIFTYLLTGVFVSILLILNYTKGIVNAFVFMAMLSTLSTLIAYAFCAIAEFKFARADKKNQQRNNALLISCGTFLYAFFAIWGAGIEMIIYSLILILIGMPIYLLKQ